MEKEIKMDDVPKNTKATVKRLFARLSRQKGRLILIFIMTLLSTFCYVTIPYFFGQALDQLIHVLKNLKEDTSMMMQLLDVLKMPALCIIGVSVLSSILSYIQQFVLASVGENLALSLRKEISAKLNRLPLNYFDNHQVGDIMSRVTSDIEKVSTVIQTGLIQFINAGILLVMICIIMINLNVSLSIITLVAIAVCGIATIFVSKWSQIAYAKNMMAMGDLGAKVEEIYAGNRVIKVFSLQSMMIDEIKVLNDIQFKANRQAQFADYAIYPSIRFLNQIGFILIAIAGGYLAINNVMTLGATQAFLQYYNQISEPITQMSYVITSMQAALAGAERVFEIVDEQEEIPDVAEELDFITQGHVQLEHVRFGYSEDKILMQDLNLEVNPNDMVAIVGPTGGGKTTLINLLMRFYELNGGKILLDGHDSTKIPRSMLRRNIGMVLQDTWLFEGTIKENIAYGKMNATDEEIEKAAKDASCDHFIRTLPKGYDTVVSSEGTQLSQGQLQLLTIARAMLTNPSILILDEATSSVDTRTEVMIQEAMKRLMQNKTSFVIAHRLSTIKDATVILVVKDGDIIEKGNHTSLLEQNGFYASLYKSQFEI